VNSVQIFMLSVAVAACIGGLLSANDAVQADPIDGRQRLWPVIRWRVVLVVTLLFWMGGISALVWLVSKSPLEQPISLDPPGVIDTSIWIPLRSRYTLLFEFSAQRQSVEQLRKLIGDQGTDGVPIALAWSLTSRRTKAVVNQGTAVTKGGQGSGDKASRWVGEIDFEPGQYQFRARILSPVPQLASISARLKLWNIFFKMSGTWQANALFLGAIATMWIVTPTVLFLVAWLMGRVGFPYLRRWMNGSRAR
jgi:hypothetical protein